MQKFGFVCEKKVFDTCVFDLVEYGDSCIDFRLDARYDQHSWDGAMQMCKDFGMDMLQMSNKAKDEWVNEYLWNSGLFGSDVTYKGVWLGAHGEESSNKYQAFYLDCKIFTETEQNCQFAWPGGQIIGEGDWFNSIAEHVTCNSNKDECLYHAPCGEEWHECSPVSSPGKRWYPDECSEENLLYACQINKNKQLNLTGWFLREFCS